MVIQWDAQSYAGSEGKWSWVVSRDPLWRLNEVVVDHFAGCCVVVATFDSGEIQPADEERSLGWKPLGRMLCIPRLTRGLSIPAEPFSEWLVYPEAPEPIETFERFVNFLGFRLGDPKEIIESYDPTWERPALDWLYPTQKRFWAQIERLSPIASIGAGDFEIVVSTNQPFGKTCEKLARAPGD